MYKLLIRPLLFLFDPESVHHFTFRLLHIANAIPGIGTLLRALFVVHHPSLERKLLGITFPGPVRLAAGFDKDAKQIGPLAA